MSAAEGSSLASAGAHGRAAALLLAAAVAVLGLLTIGPLVMLHQHYGEVLASVQNRLELARRVAAARPLIEEKLKAVQGFGGKRFFLESSSASLASAEVQDRVRRAVTEGGGRLASVQVAQPRDEGRFRQVSVTVQFNATVANLQKALATIESSEPLLFVESMTVRSQTPPNFRPAPGFDPEVFVQIDVAGFAVTQ